MDDMRQRKSKFARRRFQDLPRRVIALRHRHTQVPRLTTARIADQPRQFTVGILFAMLADPPINGPARTIILDTWPARREADVAELGLPWRSAVINLSTNHQSTADATARIRVEDRVKPLAHP